MNREQESTTINQKIFNIGLSVEEVSLYLLCCGLVDAGAPLSTKNLLERWNGRKSEFDKSLAQLDSKGIISRRLSDDEGNRVYKLSPEKEWEKNHLTG